MKDSAIQRAYRILEIAKAMSERPPVRYIQEVFGPTSKKRALTPEEWAVVEDRAREQGWSHGWQVSNRLEEINLYHDEETVYAEPGYDGNLVATGNWNAVNEYNRVTKQREPVPHGNLPERVGNLLEKLGFELAWSDEWASCDECGRLLRTQPDSHDWTPFYSEEEISRGNFVCLDCSR